MIWDCRLCGKPLMTKASMLSGACQHCRGEVDKTMSAEYRVKPVRFQPNDPTQYAGQTRWLAAKLTATGRASVWCRHYHESEQLAHKCGREQAHA